MKILMVNKFFYIKGGSETYYFSLKRMLEKEGHTVIDFSMKDDKNFSSLYSDYFVENIDYNNSKGLKNKIRIATNIIYSFEAKKKFEALVKKEKPDIIHLHIFQHQLSPSILDVAKKYKIPTVYTAHDLKMACLNYKMLHHGKICEACKGEKYYHCAMNKCVKNSFVKSCINVVEGYFHKWRRSYDIIDTVITPSEFYKSKFEEFGVDAQKIVHIPNFLDEEELVVNSRKDKKCYYLYFGRLSEEKGIMTLLKAAERTNVLLYIVGTGPIKKYLKAYIENKELKNIHLLGFMSGQPLIDLVGNAKAIIVPSEWYENGPYSAIEALKMGRPIIGADIGGIPELIEGNGILFKSGVVENLMNAIKEIELLTEEEYETMERESLKLYEKYYTWKSHYVKLNSVYHKALNRGV